LTCQRADIVAKQAGGHSTYGRVPIHLTRQLSRGFSANGINQEQRLSLGRIGSALDLNTFGQMVLRPIDLITGETNQHPMAIKATRAAFIPICSP